jgi:hypothetical protein
MSRRRRQVEKKLDSTLKSGNENCIGYDPAGQKNCPLSAKALFLLRGVAPFMPSECTTLILPSILQKWLFFGHVRAAHLVPRH